jgi:uncharacterized glyoxalase superfamily protein PhnB
MSQMVEEIDVDVDPMTAFTVFTDDFEQWWGDGHIDAWDSSRAVARRIEGGVGGRVVEVYVDDELELARITVWEPGTRVTWKSSVDDVTIDVTFEAIANGTRVRVVGSVPDGGVGAAGLSFVRMIPQWLPRHLARRAAGVTRPDLNRLHVVVRYEKPVAAAHWLVDVLGFEQTGDLPATDDGDAFSWVELRVGGSSILLWPLEGERAGAPTHDVWVYVDDLDEAFDRVEKAGTTIVEPIKHHGFKRFVCADPEGNVWSLLQARPTMGSS